MENCPNCNAALKPNAVFGQNDLFSQARIDFINEVSENKKEGYCQKCGPPIFSQADSIISKKIEDLNSRISKLLPFIPVITIQAPLGWNYKIIAMATAQTVTGTGVFAEFASTFSDLVGGQSNKYISKLANGENLCFSQLRLKAIKMGGNAVIATDIDYAEVGGDKGMLMVCMSGTVVKLLNMEIINDSQSTNVDELLKSNNELTRIMTIVNATTQ